MIKFILLTFLSQIQMFRTIQDSEGHHLTHNARPIQPLGNRDVYFVKSFNDGNDSPANEQSQLSDSKADSKTNFSETNTRSHDNFHDNNNIQNTHNNVDQEHSVDNVETTTVYQKKLSKLGRNKSINVSFTNFLVLLSTVLTTIVDLKSI